MEIDFLAAGLAGLSAFFLGYLWYNVLFSKPWKQLIGLSTETKYLDKTETPNLSRLLLGSLILEMLMALNLAAFIGPAATWQFGLGAGIATGLGFVSLALGVSYMFEGKPFKLWLINAGYNTVLFAVMGLIIGVM